MTITSADSRSCQLEGCSVGGLAGEHGNELAGLAVHCGEVWAHPPQKLDALFPHLLERYEFVRSRGRDALEQRLVMDGPVAKPLKRLGAAMYVGTIGPAFSP